MTAGGEGSSTRAPSPARSRAAAAAFRASGSIAGALSLRYAFASVIACFYHWYTAGLYASPVLLIGGWVYYSGRRDKRRGDRDGGPPDAGAPVSPLSP